MNQLEAYVFSVKQALDEAGDKLSAQDKSAGRAACDDALRWLDNNSLADREEYEHRLRELQALCSPLMSKMHGAGPQSGSHREEPSGHAGGMPGGMQGGFPGGMPGGMPGSIPGGMQGGFPGGMPGGMQGGFPGGMPGMQGGFPGGMPGCGGRSGGFQGMPGYGSRQRNDGPTIEEVY